MDTTSSRSRTRHRTIQPDGVERGQLDDLGAEFFRDNIGFAIRKAQVRIFEDFYAALAREGITPARFTALVFIEANPGLSQIRLGNYLKVARSGIVKLVDTLEKLELIERREIPGDRRSYALVLTAAGRRQLERYRQRVLEHEARIASGLTDRERATLLQLVRKLLAGMPPPPAPAARRGA